ncbi:hypothetical protein HBH56_037910 [Parastagonospora nodorum]|nr:hypothetical protein HBH56_037910 [Parastagonospora nodorum]KAH3952771.1 hypothetical protein HBH53_048570 [Parastagonospora nodorum]KAH4175127.1 hypothetical protein HBH44_006150 [Parastagonospora nodorum]KAH4370015.1 hypothetical protein HBH97_147220 [Parastagonospora nodorum]KAH4576774.1 hypothetical protein HBH84_067680 [Parastagonospora nodorum]
MRRLAASAAPQNPHPERERVLARHTGLLSPPGCSCLAGRSAFPQQRKIKAGTAQLNTARRHSSPNSSEIVANSLSRNFFPFHRSSLHCPSVWHCIQKT